MAAASNPNLNLLTTALSSLASVRHKCHTCSSNLRQKHANSTLSETEVSKLPALQNASVSVIPTPAANITVFAPTDSAFLDLFQSAGAAC